MSEFQNDPFHRSSTESSRTAELVGMATDIGRVTFSGIIETAASLTSRVSAIVTLGTTALHLK